MRKIQARTGDVLGILGAIERDGEGQRRWPCGCTVTERLGNALLCDWLMCDLHASFAPKLEIGGG